MSDISDIWQDWFAGAVVPSKGKIMKNALEFLERIKLSTKWYTKLFN